MEASQNGNSIDFSDAEFAHYEADEAVKSPPEGRDACQAVKPSRSPFECDDDYPRVVVTLDARTRVIECSDGIQWAIQKHYPKAKRRWQSIHYFRSKAGLLFYAKSDAPELLALPDWFPEHSPSDTSHVSAPTTVAADPVM